VSTWFARVRSWLALAAVLLIAAALVPPAGSSARHFEVAASLQFLIFAVAAPALLVLGAPWRLLRLARQVVPGPAAGSPVRPAAGSPARRAGGRPSGGPGQPDQALPADRIARSRSRRPGAARGVAVLMTFAALAVAWRLPASVTALARHPWLVAAELATMLPAGVAVWLELVESPPLLPRLGRPQRAGIAAVSMWTVWTMGYLMGLSHVAWSAAFRHPQGSGLSTSADQQIATGLMWAVPALFFVPVIYAVIVTWLRDSEDPDDELRRTSSADSAGAGARGWPRPPRGWQPPSA